MTLERILLPFFTENPKLEQECYLIFFRGRTGSPNTFHFNPVKYKKTEAQEMSQNANWGQRQFTCLWRSWLSNHMPGDHSS